MWCVQILEEGSSGDLSDLSDLASELDDGEEDQILSFRKSEFQDDDDNNSLEADEVRWERGTNGGKELIMVEWTLSISYHICTGMCARETVVVWLAWVWSEVGMCI